eukprot:Phypoly_transcript_04607.p1 GENE.Phypoly_transcript_04607~~Phypoly_transcript_04607.p1  ORF type:complete len:581 (+),score=186.73 Phypoly_transcript_04607:185-1927(+)
MSNLWYILNKSEHQQRLNQQIQQQLRQQLELPPVGMSSDRFQYPPNNGQPATSPAASSAIVAVPVAPTPSPRDILPFAQQFPPQQQHPEIPFDPNAPLVPHGEGHNNIEWKYHTHRPEADGDSLGRKAGKRKLVIPRDLLKMKQMNAALKIGIPPSTFSKRWRESLPDRTWPYRNHRRIEKNIKMLKAMQQKGHDVTEELGRMQQQQEENLSPAVIDVYEDVNEEYLMKTDDKKWPPAIGTGRPPGSGPPTPHHHPYAHPQLTPGSQPPQPQLQIAAIPHTQMVHPLATLQQQPLQQQSLHSPTSQSKPFPQQPHPQQSQAQPPLQNPLQAPIQASSLQPTLPPTQATTIQPPTLQSPPIAQTSPVQTSPMHGTSPPQTTIQTVPNQTTSIPTNSIQPNSLQTSPIQTSPIQTSPLQTAPIQTSPIQTSPLQQSPIQSTLHSPPQQMPPTQQMQLPQQPIPLQSQMLAPQQATPQLDPQLQIDPHRPPPILTQQAQQHAESHTTPTHLAPQQQQQPQQPQQQQQQQPEQQSLKLEQIPQVPMQNSPPPTQPPPTGAQPTQDQAQQQPPTFPQVPLPTPPP